MAAARAATTGSGRTAPSDRGRAYPMVALGQDHEALTALLAATRALLRATTPEHVADVTSTLVHDLGAGLVPARLADDGTAVQIDVSLGLSEPLLPWADPVSLAALRLTTVLPGFVEDARLVLGDLQEHAAADHDPGSG